MIAIQLRTTTNRTLILLISPWEKTLDARREVKIVKKHAVIVNADMKRKMIYHP